MNAFETAFADFAPTIAAQYVGYFTRVATRLIGEGASRNDVHKANREVSQFIRFDGDRFTSKAAGINHTWLDKQAAAYAEQTVAAFVAKLTAKLGALSDVSVVRADGATFVITGKLGDKLVSVKQQQVLKFTSYGTPFHQWPARIYVDGKFTPEAAFKKLTA